MVHIEEPAPHQHQPLTRRERLLEHEFCAKVAKTDGFWNALGRLSNYVERPLEELEGFARELCKSCFAQADQIAAGDTQLGIARAEVERLKEKIIQCNLSAMKQLSMEREGRSKTTDAEQQEEDLVTFHEPLQYLEQDTKELVLTIVNEKIRLLDNGTAPASLVQALVNKANPATAPEPSRDEQVAEMAEELEDVRMILEEVRGRADRAEDEARQARRALHDAEVKVRAMAKEAEAAKEQVAEAHARAAEASAKVLHLEIALAEAKEAGCRELEELRELRELSATQKAERERRTQELELQKREVAAKQAELERHKEELRGKEQEWERQRKELARFGEDLEQERKANAAVQAELERAQEASEAFRGQVQKLELDFYALQGRYDALKKEANEMHYELALPGKTVSHGTQTALTSTKIEENSDERKRLKVMLEEMKMKLQELMEKCKQRGVGESVAHIAEELGLQEVLRERTVFQRLYDDAVGRAQKLERLREKVQRDRKELWHGASTPRTTAAAVDDEDFGEEKSVLDSIGESKLTGRQGLTSEREKEQERSSFGAQAPGAPTSPVLERPSMPAAPILAREGVPTPAWSLQRSQLVSLEQHGQLASLERSQLASLEKRNQTASLERSPKRSEATRSSRLPPAERAATGSPQPASALTSTSTTSLRRDLRSSSSLPLLARPQASLPIVLLGINGERGRSTRTRF